MKFEQDYILIPRDIDERLGNLWSEPEAAGLFILVILSAITLENAFGLCLIDWKFANQINISTKRMVDIIDQLELAGVIEVKQRINRAFLVQVVDFEDYLSEVADE